MRNYEKLVEDYKKSFYKNTRKTSGQIYASDLQEILRTAYKGTESDPNNLITKIIEISLMGGIMIGYNARKNEEKQKKEKSTVSIY